MGTKVDFFVAMGGPISEPIQQQSHEVSWQQLGTSKTKFRADDITHGIAHVSSD